MPPSSTGTEIFRFSFKSQSRLARNIKLYRFNQSTPDKKMVKGIFYVNYSLHPRHIREITSDGNIYIATDCSIRNGTAGYGIAVFNERKIIHRSHGPIPAIYSVNPNHAELFSIFLACKMVGPELMPWAVLNDNASVLAALNHSTIARNSLHSVLCETGEICDLAISVIAIAKKFNLLFEQYTGNGAAHIESRKQTKAHKS